MYCAMPCCTWERVLRLKHFARSDICRTKHGAFLYIILKSFKSSLTINSILKRSWRPNQECPVTRNASGLLTTTTTSFFAAPPWDALVHVNIAQLPEHALCQRSKLLLTAVLYKPARRVVKALSLSLSLSLSLRRKWRRVSKTPRKDRDAFCKFSPSQKCSISLSCC